MQKIIKNYRDNKQLRKSFNDLAKKTFGLDFENWYQNGFWGEKYNPYSIIIDDKVVANVSVNITDMMWKNKKYNLIQLGTVMTDENYRNQGLIRKIMEQIEADYKDKIDGMYLFANDSVTTFYPKFGFHAAKEYQYSKEITDDTSSNIPCRITQIPMNTKSDWAAFEKVLKTHKQASAFSMSDNYELYMFYLSQFMQESVYYDKETDAYIIAELAEGNLFVHDIFLAQEAEAENVIRAFGSEVKQVTLGFTPQEKEGYVCKQLQEEDCTLFVKGEIFDALLKESIMFPTLAHA